MKQLIAYLVIPFALACQAPDGRLSTPLPTPGATPPTNLEQIVALYQQQAGVTVTYNETTALRLQAITVAPVGPAPDVLLIDADPAASIMFEIWPLQHAEAVALSNVLKRLMAAASAPAASYNVGITADARTNSLLVRAPAERLAEFRLLVERLDIELPSGG